MIRVVGPPGGRVRHTFVYMCLILASSIAVAGLTSRTEATSEASLHWEQPTGGEENIRSTLKPY